MLGGAPQRFAEVGVALHADGVGVFGAAVVAAVGALVVIANGAFLKDGGVRAAGAGLALLFCIIAGWSGALMARDLIAVFAGVETAWLAAVGLTAFYAGRDRTALNGALRMLVHGGVASALMLLGAAMLWRAMGEVNIDALPFANIGAANLAGAGAVLVLASLAVKAGLAPFHAWAGAALGRGGPAAALGAGALGMAGALLVLTRFAGYAITAPDIGFGVSAALAVLGCTSAVLGSIQAVGARNLGRLAAYACISQAGCMLLSVALGSPAGFAAALVQLLALAAAALALFGGAASGRVLAVSMLDGFAQRAPLASAAISAGALSLMGAPLTLGFLGRWRLVEAGVGAGWWWASGLAIVASLAGVFYGGRLIERMYFRRASEAFAGETSAWRLALAPALMAAIIVIAWGFAPGALLRWAASAAAMLTELPA
jgi:multicomponent Na+:H+ antiporter subunit D